MHKKRRREHGNLVANQFCATAEEINIKNNEKLPKIFKDITRNYNNQ